MIVLLLACTEPPTETLVDPTDIPTVPVPTPAWTPTVVTIQAAPTVREVWVDGAGSAVPHGRLHLLADVGGELTSIDPWGGATGSGLSIPPLRDATIYEGRTLLATDTGVLAWDGSLQSTSYTVDTTHPPERIEAHAGGLWLTSEAGVHVAQGGNLATFTLDGAAPAALAPGQRDGRPVMWASQGPDVLAMVAEPGGPVSLGLERLFDDVQGLATLADGTLFANAGGWLVERTPAGVWTRLDVGSPVRELFGAESPVLWARTDAGWLAHADDTWYRVTIDGEPLNRLDPQGRLLVPTVAGLDRVGIKRSLEILGTPADGLLALPTLANAVPSDLPGLTEVQATLFGPSTVALTVDADDNFSFLLDPGVLADGAWSLEVDAVYADGTSTSSGAVFVVGNPISTWAHDIQPLYTRSCSPCHFAGATILALDTKAAWETNHALILSQIAVEPPVMPPLTGNLQPLTPLEVLLVEVWSPDFQ